MKLSADFAWQLGARRIPSTATNTATVTASIGQRRTLAIRKLNAADSESVDGKPHVSGFVLRSASPVASNWHAERTLDAYLAEHGIVAISGVDTRKLTRHLRDHGSQNAAIGDEPIDVLRARAQQAPNMAGLDLVKLVTPGTAYTFTEGRGTWNTKPEGRSAARAYREGTENGPTAAS